jgi:hypothetical protein
VPPRAATAAATAPSTSGASLRKNTRPVPEHLDRELGLSARCRGPSARAPSSDIAPIAARTRSASVPSAPGSSIPPA